MLRCRRLRVDLEAPDAVRPVIRGLDLEIGAGEQVALMGPNGAGKSTLLRTCAGLLEPESGSIDVAAGCALLGQRPDDYLVRERVGDELPGEEGRAALAAAGLDVDPEADPRDLSGGERQRLALAIAMAGRGAGGAPARARLPRRADPRPRSRPQGRPRRVDRAPRRAGRRRPRRHPRRRVRRPLRRRASCCSPAGALIAAGPPRELLGGGWYFATETARVTGGLAITPEQGAELLRSRLAAGGAR